jgi:hypothetical protein
VGAPLGRAAEGRGLVRGREGGGLSVDGDGVALSSLRRRGDWLELRLAREHPDPATATITGGLVAARPPGQGRSHAGSGKGAGMTGGGPGAGAGFPLPGSGRASVAVPAPGPGEGRWVGAPSAALDPGGGFVIAYRVRVVDQRGAATLVARSEDGERLTAVAILDKRRFGAMSMERPALVHTPEGRWRLYLCCATPESKHWWIDVLEAAEPEGLADAEATTVFPGDDRVGVKDPVIRVGDDGRWRAWICCHPLEDPGEEDRMTTAFATSQDGLAWDWHGTALAGRPGAWDARGARVTGVLPDGRATYDGRATKEENFSERTGLARLAGPDGRLVPEGDGPVADVRYLDVLPLPGGGYRLWYEAPRADGSHELRTELIG